jgi:NAD(P)-dependent dehydrogenase (short-subunit alcohol dehydrogenase family)
MASHGAIYPDLENKTVLVTGGGSGIGAATVTAFVRQKANVAFLDIADVPSQALAADLASRGGRVQFIHADVTDTSALKEAIGTVRAEFGPIDILVNNAAHDDRHPFDAITPAYFDERIAVNLKHQFFAAQAVLPDMVARQSGVIVNLSSVSWVMGSGGMAIYTAAKSAVVGFTRSLARDYGVHNIRVTSVAPGWIRTERQEKLWITADAERQSFERQCLKRWLLPEDVAKVIVFLGSDDASAITNQHYAVDGGAS